jgi:glutamyl-tRNA synthetase
VHTAIFNWLFARHNDGVFVLRIEDTDPATAKPELIEPIMEGLRWLGLDWDEGPDVGGPFGPYRDLERRHLHDEVVERLLREGNAYHCWCTRDELVARGTEAGYDRHCRYLSEAQRSELEASGKPAAVRFAVPEDRKEVVLHDTIMGEVRSEDLQDRVIVRSDGSPLYILAVTADDIAMEITHVIRGNDLLPSTSIQILLTEALGAELPVFAHLPVLTRPDRSKLSKRKGDEGILEFRDKGFLPETMFNFLCLLGWSSPTQEEFLLVDQIIEEFTLDRVHQAPSVFDHQKLEWLQQQHVQRLDPEDFVRRVLAFRPDTPEDVLRGVAELLQTRVVRLDEVPNAISYLHERPSIEPDAAKKWLGTDESSRTLETVASRLESLDPWTAEAIKNAVQGAIEELGLHRRKGPKPIFVAISGSEVALPLFESICLIGREEAVARLRAAA